MLATTIDPVCQPEISASPTAARIGVPDGLRSTLAIFGRRDVAGPHVACLLVPQQFLNKILRGISA